MTIAPASLVPMVTIASTVLTHTRAHAIHAAEMTRQKVRRAGLACTYMVRSARVAHLASTKKEQTRRHSAARATTRCVRMESTEVANALHLPTDTRAKCAEQTRTRWATTTRNRAQRVPTLIANPRMVSQLPISTGVERALGQQMGTNATIAQTRNADLANTEPVLATPAIATRAKLACQGSTRMKTSPTRTRRARFATTSNAARVCTEQDLALHPQMGLSAKSATQVTASMERMARKNASNARPLQAQQRQLRRRR